MGYMTKHAGMLLVVLVVGCGPEKRDIDTNPTPADIDAACPTTVSGKVFAPNGTLPLYAVTVYAPVSDPPPFTEGVQCGQCSTGQPGGSTSSTTSDATGSFTLDVPPGVNVPVIVTTGKWRRKVVIPFVASCADNAQPDGTFRLPKNRSEGDMPRIAVVTGGCDPLACILPKLGIDPTEFGDSVTGANRVVFYGASGESPGAPKASTVLWGSLDEMKKFDVIINSCECSEVNTNKTSPDLLRQYADLGGRVFGSHFHYTWTKNLIPVWAGQATWTSGSSTTPDLVDMSFPKGQALAQWLVAVGGSTTLGQITLGTKTYNASTVAATSQRWLYSSGVAPATSHYLSFDTPVNVPAAQQCGKVVFAGMHVSAGSVGSTFPAACNATFSADEKALAFLLFDLSSCVGTLF